MSLLSAAEFFAVFHANHSRPDEQSAASQSAFHAKGTAAISDSAGAVNVTGLQPATVYRVVTLLGTPYNTSSDASSDPSSYNYEPYPSFSSNISSSGVLERMTDSSGSLETNKWDNSLAVSSLSLNLIGKGMGDSDGSGIQTSSSSVVVRLGKATLPCSVTSVTDTLIVCTPATVTAAQLGLGDVSVVFDHGEEVRWLGGWSYNGGSLAGLSVRAGPLTGGNRVVVELGAMGTNDVVNVTLCGVPATILYQSSHSITVVAADATTYTGTGSVVVPSVAGHVTVYSSARGLSVWPYGYTYYPTPVIFSVAPNVGPKQGGTLVTITGEHLGNRDVCIVTLNGVAAAIRPGQSPTQVVVLSQNGSLYSGTWDVKVTSKTHGVATAVGAWTYHSGCCWLHSHDVCFQDRFTDPACNNVNSLLPSFV